MKGITRTFNLGDRKVFYFLNSGIKCRFLDIFMYYITKLGGPIFASALPLLLIAFGGETLRGLGIEILVSLSLTTLIVQILKKSISRERPYNALENVNTYDIVLKDYSFPSGHTAASFTIATVIYLNIPALTTLLMITAMLVALSRVYLAVHYPSDILAGVIIGTMTATKIHSYFISVM